MNNKHIKNILIIGGTYFAGRAFTELLINENSVRRESGNDNELINIVHINRGTVSVAIRNLTSVNSDRRDYDNLQKLLSENISKGTIPSHFNTIVDFCGYQEGDIKDFCEVLDKTGINFDHYILLSTVDVLEHGTGKMLSEDAGYEYRPVQGDTGLYIEGKKALEKELILLASHKDFSYTILRPTFIYGPGNYAPRENIFFTWIQKAGEILCPVDADGQFQMVYVYDLAKIIYICCQNEKALNQIYNVTGPLPINYRSFAKALVDGITVPINIVSITTDDCISGDVPMPFPMMNEESNLYNGDKLKEIFDSYTSLQDGLAISYSFFTGK